MSRISWTTTRTVPVAEHTIPISEELGDQGKLAAGIRRDPIAKLVLKTILWRFVRLRDYLLVDGFIERQVGDWISELVQEDTVFLEVGCGDMSLRRFLPSGICYNAFDLSLSEFHLRRVLGKDANVNVALASATNIPLPTGCASLIVSTECFEHIPEIDRAVDEIHRVAAPGATLVCSIPNNFCYKYQKKGPHPDHVNNWTFDGFKDFMASHGFEFVRGSMKGFWIALPLWLAKTSYQLPVSSADEFLNTNFFYLFAADK